MSDVPQASDVLGSELPLHGSDAQAYAMVTVLQSVSEDVRDVRHAVTLSLIDLGMLQGAGLSSLMSFLIEHLMTGCARVIDDIESASQAFTRFARTCETLDAVAGRLVRECDETLTNISSAWHTVRLAGHSIGPVAVSSVPHSWRVAPPTQPPPETMCVLETQMLAHALAEWQRAAEQWQDSLDEIGRLHRDWERVVRERRTAEQQLAVVLEGSMLMTAVLTPSTGQRSRALLTRAITGLPVHARHRESHTDLARLISGELSPREAAETWHASRYSRMTATELRALPPAVLLGLAGAVGLPAGVQNTVARAALAAARTDPQSAYRVMGFAGSELTLSEFTQQVQGLHDALQDFELQVREAPLAAPVQLLGLGNHDDSLTATITIGDLDTATHMGVNVSGMFSDTDSMASTVSGVKVVYDEAMTANQQQTYAVAHWIGYKSPGILPGDGSVLALQRARSGGYQLGQFIDGVVASREVSGSTLPHHTAVLSHSYGSTTAVEALKSMTHTVDHLVTYGSAGVHATTTQSLNVHKISATSAKGDQVAWAGIVGGGRTDPRDLDGVVVFSSEAVGNHRRVTMHDMYAEIGERSLLNPVKRGYLSEHTHSVHYMGRVLAGLGAEQ